MVGYTLLCTPSQNKVALGWWQLASDQLPTFGCHATWQTTQNLGVSRGSRTPLHPWSAILVKGGIYIPLIALKRTHYIYFKMSVNYNYWFSKSRVKLKSEGWVAVTMGFSSPRDEMVWCLPHSTLLGTLRNQLPVLHAIRTDRPSCATNSIYDLLLSCSWEWENISVLHQLTGFDPSWIIFLQYCNISKKTRVLKYYPLQASAGGL